MPVILSRKGGGGGSGGAPSGPAGGDLAGTYPNPTLDSALLDAGYCRASHNASQNAADNAWDSVALNTDDEDAFPGGMHDPVTNNQRITIPANYDGLWLIEGHVQFAANAAGSRFLRLVKNGETDGDQLYVDGPYLGAATFGNYRSVSTVARLAAADYIVLQTFQNTGGDLALTTPFLQLTRIGG